MHTFMVEGQEVIIPDWVSDLESFRRWADADDFPDIGHICWLGGVWIDLSKEQIFWHLLVKTEIAATLSVYVKQHQLGLLLTDGGRLSNEEADLSTVPDGLFLSNDARRAARVRILEGMEEGRVEIEGTPDMVLEVVSRNSIRKDTVTLREKYWKAGIPEYWLVDARKGSLSFDILRHTSRRYVASRKPDGWIRSQVFGCSFRLSLGTDSLGDPTYTLESR